MTESVTLMGVVLYAAPVGEYDKRLVILTKELGKITAFAKGARRQNSPFLSACNPFVFGSFTLYPGKNAYSLIQTNIAHHFRELAIMHPQVYYGFYFLEFAEYYARENNSDPELVNLIFVALRALQHEKISSELVRYIFEIRIMAINGEFALNANDKLEEATKYAISFILKEPVQKLFSFTVKNSVLREIKEKAETCRKQVIDRKFKSLSILNTMLLS